MVFTESSLAVLASKKKIDFLKPLQEAQKKHEGFPSINLLLRDKVQAYMQPLLTDCFSDKVCY